MKAYFGAISIFLLLLAPRAGQAQWVQLPAPPDSDEVTGLVANGPNLFVLGGGADGSQFGGVIAYIFRSTDQGASWSEVDSGLTGVTISTSPIVVGSNLFVGTGYFGTGASGLFTSTNNGSSWHPANVNSDSEAMVDRLYESGGKLLAAEFDTGTFHVFLSTDTGDSWASVGSPNVDFSTLAAIDTDLFFGTPRNGVYRSSDNGINWIAINNGFPFDSSHGYYVSCNTIVQIGSTIFAGTQNGIFLTTDNGMSWAPANTGLPAKTPVNSFVASGANIFTGTGRGIFLSTNNGMNWTAVNDGLTVISMNGLLLHDSTLFATTGFPFAAPGTIWKRPISEMIPSSAVASTPPLAHTLTAYPNPSTQSATISVTSSESGQAEITIVNLLGEEVARLFEGTLVTGSHTFTWDGRGVSPGVYECVARVGASVERVRVVLLR